MTEEDLLKIINNNSTLDVDGSVKYVHVLDYGKLVSELLEAIRYTRCSENFPSKEIIKTVASNKALKYAYANEDTYGDYVKAIEEGADYVKNYIIKHE